jgi:hypothetical protein
MAWPSRTWVAGELVFTSLGNQYIRDPLVDLRAGGIAIASQAAGDFIRPSSSTQWARLGAVSGQYPALNGTPVWGMANAVATAAWPVGSIYESVLPNNPNIILGIGTWVAHGVGRVTVAIDAGQTEFDAVDETGGAKTITLTTSQIASHNHIQDAHNHTQDAHSHTISTFGDSLNTEGDPGGTTAADNSGTKTTTSTTATNNAATATNQNTGGDGAHQNCQPYIVFYRWRRSA